MTPNLSFLVSPPRYHAQLASLSCPYPCAILSLVSPQLGGPSHCPLTPQVRPLKNMMEYNGIEAARIEAMEERLKKDVLAEVWMGAVPWQN